MKTFKKQIKYALKDRVCGKIYDRVSKEIYNTAISKLDTSLHLGVFNRIHDQTEKRIYENETSKIRN